jgi:hypothetical protein
VDFLKKFENEVAGVAEAAEPDHDGEDFDVVMQSDAAAYDASKEL